MLSIGFWIIKWKIIAISSMDILQERISLLAVVVVVAVVSGSNKKGIEEKRRKKKSFLFCLAMHSTTVTNCKFKLAS